MQFALRAFAKGDGARHGPGARGVVVGMACAAIAMVAIFRGAEWYAEEVSVPRYCDAPDQAVARVAQILTASNPAGESSKRPYIVAAKLLYLVPRREAEATDAYLDRLRGHIQAKCR